MKANFTQEENMLDRKASKHGKKKRRSFRLLKFLSTVILVSGILVLIALSPVCTIGQITMEGNQHYKDVDILGIVNIVKGNNGFKTLCRYPANIFTLRFIEDERIVLKTFPYIKDIRIKYVIPDKVKISVTERKPAGIASNNGINLIIDNEGYVLDIAGKVVNAGIPLIKGIKFDRYELGQDLKPLNPSALETAFTMIKAIENSDAKGEFKLLELVNYIDTGNSQKVLFEMDSRLTVTIGDMQELDYKLSFLKQIYLKNLKKDDRGELDFSSGKDPSFKPESTAGKNN